MTYTDLVGWAFALVILCTMPVFALVGRERSPDPDMSRRAHTVLLGRWIKEWLVWLIAPFERAMVVLNVSPASINVVGVLLGLASGVAFARGQLMIAGWLILLGGAADVFDGRVARARNMVTKSGAFLDSTLDRFSESFTFLGLILYLSGNALGMLLVAAALSGSLLVSYTRARGEALGAKSAGGLMQRAERLVVLAVASIFDTLAQSQLGMHHGWLLVGAIGLIAAGTWGTATWRLVATYNSLRAMERTNG